MTKQRNARGRFQKGSQPNPKGKPRRNYDLTVIIEGKKRGLSGEQISRKIGKLISANHVNWLWRKHNGLQQKEI